MSGIAVVLGNLHCTYDLQGESQDYNLIFTTLSDALVMFAKTFNEITRARRDILKKDINYELKELLDAEKNPPTPDFLAGDDLTNKIKAIKEGNRLKAQLKRQQPQRAVVGTAVNSPFARARTSFGSFSSAVRGWGQPSGFRGGHQGTRGKPSPFSGHTSRGRGRGFPQASASMRGPSGTRQGFPPQGPR